MQLTLTLEIKLQKFFSEISFAKDFLAKYDYFISIY